MDNKQFIVLLFSVFFIGAFLGGFFEEEEELTQKILIDEYFDEKINETVCVYCLNEELFYNITNHNQNSIIICYFNVSSGYLKEGYIYNRGDVRCIREKLGTNISEIDI